MSKRPELVIVDGDLKGKVFEVPDGCIRLGRSSSNDIKVLDEELSRNHCLFEGFGENGIRLTDLASANGTFLNGKELGAEPVELKEGDTVTVGRTTIRVGKEPPSRADFDLGLGVSGDTAASGSPTAKKGRPYWLWISAAVLAVLSVPLFFFDIGKEDNAPIVSVTAADTGNSEIREVLYEVVEADREGIYRYEFTAVAGGDMTVRIDDVPEENRHHVKKKAMSAEVSEELLRILGYDRMKNFDSRYIGVQPDPPSLKKCRLKIVYPADVVDILVENAPEPGELTQVRKELEAFTKSELGIWAVQYSREKLLELAEDAVRVGTAKWEDRSVQYGNLHDSIKAYKEALFYLETLNPKPECYETARAGLERSTAEMERVYSEQRFKADRALNLAQWDVAVKELRVLMEMIPDRKDRRNRDARDKLISAEKHLQRGRSR